MLQLFTGEAEVYSVWVPVTADAMLHNNYVFQKQNVENTSVHS